MAKNYQLNFCAQRNSIGYNEIALVEMFRNILNIVLAYKLVEIEGMNEELTLEEWYLKTVEFKRVRQVIEGIFRRQAINPLESVSRIEKKQLRRMEDATC